MVLVSHLRSLTWRRFIVNGKERWAGIGFLFYQAKFHRETDPNAHRFAPIHSGTEGCFSNGFDACFIQPSTGQSLQYNRFCHLALFVNVTLNDYGSFYFGFPDRGRVGWSDGLEWFWWSVVEYKLYRWCCRFCMFGGGGRCLVLGVKVSKK